MLENNFENCNSSIDPSHSQFINNKSNKSQKVEQHCIINDENTEVIIDSENEEEFSSSELSEDEEEEEENDDDNEVENMSSENNFQKGNIIQSLNQCNCPPNLHNLFNTTQNVNVTFYQPESVVEVMQMNNDHLITQTMAALAAKYRPTKSIDSPPTESEILSFIGPCPLYSLSSSFGLDMHHGLSHFPCRDIFVDDRNHIPSRPLWQHLTSSHNLNLSSSSLLISHLLLHGYSLPCPILFNSHNTKNILRTTPRYSLIKKCPLTTYGVYGIQYEHGTRLCSGYTYNTNIYSHLISFHKMTHNASLCLSRAIAFHDKQFKFKFDEIIVSESRKCPVLKLCQIKESSRVNHHQCHHLLKKVIKKKPVKNILN
ncbi:unnamed protein product [Rotaria sp. Silwood1]|nr:unnamed protein product [Rotaria sp. Silwood1]CAF1128326.1 unnamed protein product [Rotaria sp. Silwood1]CAF3466913.1 unnamed protein product [Rotaria sp. Silwood1]CAF4564105.1 unnamed protein product [Rotaria sp. Silwood1]CAF4786287.1 unnamed protein product [Rotaria sp. Silwood1]